MSNNPAMFKNGCIKKPAPNPTNYKFAKLALNKSATQANIPKKYSLKDKFPAVYNQMYGNCTSNAVLAVDAYYYHNPKGSWVPSTVFTYYNQRKMDETLKDGDCGSTVETGLDAVRKFGACNSTIWANDAPYDKKPSKAAYADGLKGHELTKYYAVKTILQVKKAISSGYPVVGSFTWVKFSVDENSILLPATKQEAKKSELGHAVVIVGYDDTNKLFEFRNSWGENWGNKGYAYMTYSQFKLLVWWDDIYAVIK